MTRTEAPDSSFSTKRISAIKIASFVIVSCAYLFVIGYILRCYPPRMMPDDLYIHMSVIQQYIVHGKPYFFGPQELFIRPRWHFVWSEVFQMLRITDVSKYPEIIFRAQGIITFTSVAYAAAKFYSLSVEKTNLMISMIVGFCAALLFFLGTGVSMESWFVRYGTTYQITLPLSFVLDALILEAIIKGRLRLAQGVAAVFLAAIIIAFHAMEFVYVMIFGAISIAFYRRSLSCRKVAIGTIAILTFLAALTFIPDINKKLHFGINNGYRFDIATFKACCSEFILISLIIGILSSAFIYFKKENNKNISTLYNKPFLIIVFYSLTMVAIPLPLISRAASFLPAYDVFRFYFGSAWFAIVPMLATFPISGILKEDRGATVVISTSILIGASLLASSMSTTHTSLMNARSLITATDEAGLTNWNAEHLYTVKKYLAGQDMQRGIFIARSDIALMINMLGGFTTFEDIQTADSGRIISAERRAVAVKTAPPGYKLVKVPDLFPMDDSLKNIGWEQSVNDLRMPN